MIQYHHDLQQRANKFNQTIAGQFGQIQKIYSTSHFICINLRFPGKSRYLYLGRGGGHEGFWEGEEKPSSILRVRDRYLDYLRKYLISGLVTEVHVDTKDRIFTLIFQRFGQKNYFMVFWSGRKSYFLTYTFTDPLHPRLFMSWKGEVSCELNESEDSLLSYFDEVGRTEQTASSTKMSREINELLQEEEKIVTFDKKIKKKENFLTKKINNIKTDLSKVEIYKDLQKIAEDPELDLAPMKELKKNHFTLKFKNEDGHFQKLNSLYSRIKKLKSAKNILEKREIETTSELKEVKSKPEAQVERIVEKIAGPVWSIEKKEAKSKTLISNHGKNLIDEFQLKKINIGVGLTAQGNDFLRSSWGSSGHLWFHLEGSTSAHIVVKVEHLSQLTAEELSVVASMLWEYSKKPALIDGDLIPLLFTHIKNLKGVKGTTGSVIYKKEKHLSISYLSRWRNLVTSK